MSPAIRNCEKNSRGRSGVGRKFKKIAKAKSGRKQAQRASVGGGEDGEETDRYSRPKTHLATDLSEKSGFNAAEEPISRPSTRSIEGGGKVCGGEGPRQETHSEGHWSEKGGRMLLAEVEGVGGGAST